MLKPRPSFAALAIVLSLTASLTLARATFQTSPAPEPVRVGVFADVSGQRADLGVALRDGVQMAADEINALGGVGGRPVVLFFRDTEGHPPQAFTAARSLIYEQKVHALLGEVASSNALAAAPAAQEAGVPFVTPAASNSRVTQVGDYVFRVCFIDPFQGEALAKFAAHTLKARRAAVLADFGSDYSGGMAEVFIKKFSALGGRITSKQTYSQVDTDFAGQLAAIRATRPEVIFVPGYFNQVGVIARQARRLGMRQTLLGGDGWDAPQLWKSGGAALDGSYMTGQYAPAEPSPANRKFVAAYRDRYGREPDAIAALGYDSMGLLADALRRAGSTDPAKLRDAVARTNGYAGVTGDIHINAARDAVKPAAVFRLQDRKFVYQGTVAPDAPEKD